MLSAKYIDELLTMDLSVESMGLRLRELTPEKLDVRTLGEVIEAVQNTASGVSAELLLLGRQALDPSGTGGSGLTHFNTSTTCAFVLAAGGVKVMKAGNVAASSKCGSFDLLSVLGFPNAVQPEGLLDIFRECGLAFLFAPFYYPLLKKLVPVRRALGVKTIFNYIGPLLNPARPAFRLMGVSDKRMQELISSYLSQGPDSALLVHAESGLDEIDAFGATSILQVAGKEITFEKFVSPFAKDMDDRALGVMDNLEIFQGLLSGKDKGSQYFHQVTLNAGAGFYAYGQAPSIMDGQKLASDLLLEGEASGQLEKCRRAYAKYA